jgi:hypothetical protein
VPSTTVTLRPDALYSGGSGWTFGGGATTIYGATSDSADATYAMSAGTVAKLTFTDLTTVPVGAQIRSVACRLRVAGNSVALYSLTMYRLGSTKRHTWTAGSKPGTLATVSFQPQANDVGGGPWTVDLVNRISIEITATTTAVHFVELYLDVVYNEIPVVSSVGPTGSLTTQTPVVTWSYSDPDGDVQERFQVRVFPTATVSAAGFNASTSVSTRDSGEQFSSDPQWSTGAVNALSPGVYYAYVKAADAGSSGRYSAWASASFTVTGDPPAPPTLVSATADTSNGRNVITVRSQDSYLTNQQATGDGASGELIRWTAVTNASTIVIAAAGLAGNSVRFTVVGAGAATVRTTGTGTRGYPVVGGTLIAWGGWVRSGTVAGTAHCDLRAYDSTGVDLGTTGRVSNTVTISGTYQACSGTATLPANAAYLAVEWVIAAGGAGQLIDVDYTEVRPVTLTGQRGGLDSRNLFGKLDSTFNGSSLGGWIKTTGLVGTVAQAADAAAFDAQSLQYQPGTVGASHAIQLTAPLALPVHGGELGNAATYQFHFFGRGNVANLTVGIYINWSDDLGAVVGAPAYGGSITLANSASFTKYGMTAVAPDGATHWNVQLVLAGELNTTDRWVFDQFGFVRVAAGTTALQVWKPSPAVDTWPQVEYSDDAGATWTLVRLTNLSLYDPITRLGVVYDYEVVPNVARLYRARTAGLDFVTDPISGASLLSNPSSSAACTLTVTDFYLIDPYTQTRLLLPLVGDVGFTSTEPQGVFDPLGRTSPVVQSDVVKTEQFALRLAFNTAASYDAFEVVRATRHVLWLQSPATRAWYVKLGPSRATVWGMGTTKDTSGGKFQLEIAATEVSRPS